MQPTRRRCTTAWSRYVSCSFPHLDIEDEQILPAIAESIPPKKWERMDKAALKSIPRKYLPIASGALDEYIQGLPETAATTHRRRRSGSCWRCRGARSSSNWVKPLLV